MVTTTPAEVRVRMYNVGFGDCFLLSFTYRKPVASDLEPDKERLVRHVLFDFGTTSRARTRVTLARLAERIASDCEGRLDAVVVSHRHADHVSGFGSRSTAKTIRSLAPLLVVRSWTENPRAAPDSRRPSDDFAIFDGHDPDQTYLSRLLAGEQLMERIVDRARTAGRGLRTNLVEGAQSELRNARAVTELDELSKSRRGEYLSAGRRTRLNAVAPGVTFTVLGPPTPRQWPPVARQAAESDEFWLAGRSQLSNLFASSTRARDVPLGTGRWIIDQLLHDGKQELASLVRWLDDALNNTSIILMVSVGDHRLLFGGDAQIENWGWALDQAAKHGALSAELAAVDLYKVGHHGSRNGTPKSLFEIWESRPGGQLVSMMSTKAGVHGLDEHAVPRTTLVEALRSLGPLLSTDDNEGDWIEAKAAVPAGQFEISLAPG